MHVRVEVRIDSSWKNLLIEEFSKDYFHTLTEKLKTEYRTESNSIFPKGKDIFRALDLTPVDKVSVVILGQDPYHGVGEANGLAFSVNKGVRVPPSLKNIFIEIEDDIKIKPDVYNGDLTRWAEQGVLLLNNVLTVKANTAGSHRGLGWEMFTKSIIEKLSKHRKNIVYILWGKDAQSKESILNSDQNLIIKSPHPSPFSARTGFFGSKPFSKTNDYLISKGKTPIDWR